VDRLARQGLATTTANPTDRRRLTVALAPAGHALFTRLAETALMVSDRTLGPLKPKERKRLLALLARLT